MPGLFVSMLLTTKWQVNEEGDSMRRLDFCTFLNVDMDDFLILRKILWIDESRFDNKSLVVYQKVLY